MASTFIPPMLVTLSTSGNRYNASINGGSQFFVGRQVSFGSRIGLQNLANLTLKYDPADHTAEFGFWAHFIQPTAICESGGRFHCLNTYDRAMFTFGFFQQAAHTANANFVLLLRRLLALPSAAAYFPDLKLINNRVHRETTSGQDVPLESSTSTEPLMDYLNPTSSGVETIEAINSAKFVHWATNDSDHRRVQVEFSIEDMKKKMNRYSRRYGLNGASDEICLVICDIRHQGRAKSTEIIAALGSSSPLNGLLSLGAASFSSRISKLKRAMTDLRNAGLLGTKTYDHASGEFV